MDLNKHIVAGDNGSPFHSNGFARIVNGNRIGSTGRMTFAQRQNIDKNRRLIYGYQRSSIGSAYGSMRAAAILPNNTVGTGNQAQSRQQFNSMGGANAAPARKYDPYA